MPPIDVATNASIDDANWNAANTITNNKVAITLKTLLTFGLIVKYLVGNILCLDRGSNHPESRLLDLIY